MIAISKRWEEKQNAVMISSNLCNFQETLLPVQICRGSGKDGNKEMGLVLDVKPNLCILGIPQGHQKVKMKMY